MKTTIFLILLVMLNLFVIFTYGWMVFALGVFVQFVYAFMFGACKMAGEYDDQSR